jgi:hypothetical protein
MKKRSWKHEIARFDVHSKTGKEQFLSEVARAYETLYPNKADYFKQSLRELRNVTTDGYSAGRAGQMECSIRVPTELWLFIQRWIPDFGKDSSDIQLLSRVWCDLVRAKKDRRRCTRLVVSEVFPRVSKSRPVSEKAEGAGAAEVGSEGAAEGGPAPGPADDGEDGTRKDGAGLGGDDREGLRGVIAEDAGVPPVELPQAD